MMKKIKRHGRSRRPDVQHGDGTLESVMSGFVEEVTDCHDAHRLAGEIHCQPRCASRKYMSHGIQFLTAIAKVISSYDKVGSAERRAGREQKCIFAVPKSMARRLRQRRRFDRLHHRVRFERSRLQQRERNLLRQRRSAQTKNNQQNACFRSKNLAQPGCQHNVSECPTWPLVLVLTQCRTMENGPSVLLNSRWSEARVTEVMEQDRYDATAMTTAFVTSVWIPKRRRPTDLNAGLSEPSNAASKNDEATELQLPPEESRAHSLAPRNLQPWLRSSRSGRPRRHYPCMRCSHPGWN
jgi:hypothetical protein